MNNFSNNEPIVFLLGAGFNCDAAAEAGKTKTDVLDSIGRPARYPLVGDLLEPCFGLKDLPPNKSIEDIFQESIESGDRKPLEALYEWLMALDEDIALRLRRKGSHDDNAYTKFLGKFRASPLLTFNYDSLPELLLLSERSWCPMDGYGVEVQADKVTIRRGEQPVEKSLRPVLHLHGSLCVYPVTYGFEKRLGSDTSWMVDLPPKFKFDPDALGNLFHPFEGVHHGLTRTPVHERVIAPIPDKAEGLEGEFIKAVYGKAVNFLSAASQIICIGYSFNQHDQHSYAKLLHAASGKSVLVVAPDSESLIERLATEYPEIEWSAQNMSFANWVSSDYPGAKLRSEKA
ncbi:MAG: hypothetical protein WCA63_03400 [Gallionella sp.]